jgi:ABC-type nitrate/sulfonate/bicarbonate transport system substrate-binding protein
MKALRTVLTFASLLILGLPAVAVAEPTKVAIGYPPATDFLAAYVAKEQGIFDKHNIDATTVGLNSFWSPVLPGTQRSIRS